MDCMEYGDGPCRDWAASRRTSRDGASSSNFETLECNLQQFNSRAHPEGHR